MQSLWNRSSKIYGSESLHSHGYHDVWWTIYPRYHYFLSLSILSTMFSRCEYRHNLPLNDIVSDYKLRNHEWWKELDGSSDHSTLTRMRRLRSFTGYWEIWNFWFISTSIASSSPLFLLPPSLLPFLPSSLIFACPLHTCRVRLYLATHPLISWILIKSRSRAADLKGRQ